MQKEKLTLARLSVHSPIIGSVIFKTTHRSLLGVWYIPLRKVQFESYPRVHGAKRPVTDSMREYLNLIPICQKKIFIWKWQPRSCLSMQTDQLDKIALNNTGGELMTLIQVLLGLKPHEIKSCMIICTV